MLIFSSPCKKIKNTTMGLNRASSRRVTVYAARTISGPTDILAGVLSISDSNSVEIEFES
jgi:hypothetical protein